MIDRAKALGLAKKLREVATELEEYSKANPELFNHPKDTVVVRGKKNVGLYIDAQKVIKKWAELWAKEYKAEPVVQKSWMFMVVAVLKRKPVQELLDALDNYFRDEDKYVWQKMKSPFPYFIGNINKYLPQKEKSYEPTSAEGMG